MSIFIKLLEAQKEMPVFTKDTLNPYFNKMYAELSSILKTALPILNKHGIVFFSTQKHVESLGWVMDIELIDSEDGSKINTTIPMIGVTDMQKMGSAKTYARRYGLLDLLGSCAGDDDDGNVTKDSPKLVPKTLSKPEAKSQFKKVSSSEVKASEEELDERVKLNQKLITAYNNNSKDLMIADKNRAEIISQGVVTNHKGISLGLMKGRLAWIEMVTKPNQDSLMKRDALGIEKLPVDDSFDFGDNK